MFILGVILLLVVTVFVLENRTRVSLQFLGWRYDTQLGLAILAAAIIGAFVIYLSGLAKQRELRAQARVAEMRLRELERQQKQAAADETQQPARP